MLDDQHAASQRDRRRSLLSRLDLIAEAVGGPRACASRPVSPPGGRSPGFTDRDLLHRRAASSALVVAAVAAARVPARHLRRLPELGRRAELPGPAVLPRTRARARSPGCSARSTWATTRRVTWLTLGADYVAVGLRPARLPPDEPALPRGGGRRRSSSWRGGFCARASAVARRRCPADRRGRSGAGLRCPSAPGRVRSCGSASARTSCPGSWTC